MSNLTPADLEAFAKLRIPSELLELAGIVRVSDGDARNNYGIRGSGDMAGIAFPYFDPETMSNGRRRHYVRIRRDNPEVEDGKTMKKYVCPYGDRKHFYFPPRPPALFADFAIPIVLVEAEKSCLALTAWSERTDRKILPLAMGGCWGWRGQVGIKETPSGERVPETGAIRDLNICRDGRKTYVLLDANCASNPKVLAARSQLVRQLRKQGADVAILDLPVGEGVNGPDDYISVHGDEAMARLFDGAADGEKILSDLEAFLRRYIVMTDAQFTAVALWIVHTYAFLVSIWTPYLAITSATKRSGKTRLMEALSYLVHKPWFTSGASAASLFREIDQKRPTLLLDETDALFKADKEMAEAVRMVLNAGAHHKGTVSRVVGQGTEMKTKDFKAYCPKALGGIGALPDTIADRSIQIRLQRKLHGSKVERLRERTIKPEADRLRDRISEWIEKQLPSLKSAEPDLPEELNDRQQDGAEILLSIADAAGGDWPAKARRTLIELCTGGASEDQSIHARLLADIRIVFEEQASEKFFSEELVKALAQIETSPWAEWKNEKPMTPIQLARMLKEFDICPRSIRIGTENKKGYERDFFTSAWERYLPADTPFPANRPVTPSQASVYTGESDFSTRHTDSAVTGSKSEESPVSMHVVTDVTGQNSGNGDVHGKEPLSPKAKQGSEEWRKLIPNGLRCSIHGLHHDWWMRLLPGGAEPVCGLCELEPREDRSVFSESEQSA